MIRALALALLLAPQSAPLTPHPKNPRWFADASGKAIVLAGAHTWPNLVDMGPADPPPRFNFTAHLDYLERYGHNFTRLWTWESTTWNARPNKREATHTVFPLPYARTGPGAARDGKLKFDLTQFNPSYFDRLRQRVEAAGKRGIYVSVMLFEGWAMQHAPGAWESHPFHPDNNVNGINGDANGDGRGLEIHELVDPKVRAIQEAYVRKVVETVNAFDHVLYEISNENHPASTPWQYHMIRFIQDLEKSMSKRHPVGMTFQYKGGSNRTLLESPADWISPNPDGGWRDDPPAEAAKIVLSDTDHLWGIGGTSAWAWKTFLRGHHPIFMDPYDGAVLETRFDSKWEPLLKALGEIRRVAERVDLASMAPRGDLASSKFCLANPGKEYLVYTPGGEVTLDLTGATGDFVVEWVQDGAYERTLVRGGAKVALKPRFGGDAVAEVRPSK
jgi:hypothetical protein